MIYGIRGWQDTGKTALAIGVAKELVFRHGYAFDEVVANLSLTRWPGAHSLTVPEMRLYVRKMVRTGLKHKIIILDEADRLFPARFWHNAEQTEALLGLWQDEKLFNRVIYTSHHGTSIDLMMRQTTQIELEPDYDSFNDCIPFRVYNAIDGIVYDDCLLDVSKMIFPDYNRWEVVGAITEPPGAGIRSPN